MLISTPVDTASSAINRRHDNEKTAQRLDASCARDSTSAVMRNRRITPASRHAHRAEGHTNVLVDIGLPRRATTRVISSTARITGWVMSPPIQLEDGIISMPHSDRAKIVFHPHPQGPHHGDDEGTVLEPTWHARRETACSRLKRNQVSGGQRRC